MKNIKDVMLDYKILSLANMIALEQCKLGYKLCHNLLPKKMSQDMMTDHHNKSTKKVHKYNTQNKLTPNLQQLLDPNIDPVFCSSQSVVTLLWMQR